MKKLLNKIHFNLGLFFSNFVKASKTVEDGVFTQKGVDNSSNSIHIGQDVRDGINSISKDLLKGELTEEVKQLRYRTYKVDREAKKFKYFSPTLAMKKKSVLNNKKRATFDNSDGLDVVVIQENKIVSEGVLDGLNQIENEGRQDRRKYFVEIERDFVPTFRLEAFLKKIVVKRKDDEHAVLDLYFPKYASEQPLSANDKSFRIKQFVNELERIKTNGNKSNILSMDRLRFVTNNAWGYDDLYEFKFINLWFRGISEFKDNYILKFDARIELDGSDLTEKFYNKEMSEKYENKDKRKVEFNPFISNQVKVYKCQNCGKEMVCDYDLIDNAPIIKPRLVDEDSEYTVDQTEYLDLQIIEQTTGKQLCGKCLKDYLKN